MTDLQTLGGNGCVTQRLPDGFKRRKSGNCLVDLQSFLNFYWSIIDLQCCASFRGTALLYTPCHGGVLGLGSGDILQRLFDQKKNLEKVRKSLRKKSFKEGDRMQGGQFGCLRESADWGR